MSEVRFYNDGQPIDSNEHSEGEFNQQNNPVQLNNNMISQQEVSSPELLRGEITDEYDELDDTIDNNIPVVSPSLSGEAISDYSNESSMESEATFFDREESEDLNQQWMEIQGKFVDEPRVAVQKADELISDMIQQITSMFDKELETLETQWNQGEEASTEDLRMTFQHYRSFFHRLVD